MVAVKPSLAFALCSFEEPLGGRAGVDGFSQRRPTSRFLEVAENCAPESSRRGADGMERPASSMGAGLVAVWGTETFDGLADAGAHRFWTTSNVI